MFPTAHHVQHEQTRAIHPQWSQHLLGPYRCYTSVLKCAFASFRWVHFHIKVVRHHYNKLKILEQASLVINNLMAKLVALVSSFYCHWPSTADTLRVCCSWHWHCPCVSLVPPPPHTCTHTHTHSHTPPSCSLSISWKRHRGTVDRV